MKPDSSVQELEATADRVPIAWSVAASTAQRLMRPGPVLPLAEAEATVARLRDFSVSAEAHVREVTGLGAGLPLYSGEVVDRPGWAQAAVVGLAALMDDALAGDDPSTLLGGVAAGSAGVQTGVVLAYLGSRVLGQYDPFGGEDGSGHLLLVAPNVVAARQALDVPAEDFEMWVCLHEATHRLQFNAVPWLRDHFASEVGSLLSSMDDTLAQVVVRLPELVRSARRRGAEGEPVGLMELLQSPEQRVRLDRLIALSTLLEGHADHVMDAAGPSVVPSVRRIRARFTARRRGGGVLDRVLRSVLGVEAKVRQYADGAQFTEQVVDAVGMAGFNEVWRSPETLPSRAEISRPSDWLDRVHG
ncbi:zinc-dependent metalloprotease [Actinoalloteichus hymeniacidonis]|uniref:Coenzyme F420 biosynthesis-associated protein n=1 Tax=Actinoalloteichus hymeniacidonis TaxID=340345 RepID=A0AAC9MWJ6_9PSEU|nr:zinc-dependent metalloprotease [Actinoalloteichus hymeniacidonis]AOS61169.1 hypothetical protein TL08_01650 [Actinoalloteichus hymeniacidonis]MBB5910830.1 coenzyme F420 biosynthesis associated uncharacterized protein [Actinoalloteichus hymeniacidonis]